MLWVLIWIATPSTHNICFYGELTKIIFELSSNTLLICSTVWFLPDETNAKHKPCSDIKPFAKLQADPP